MGKIETLDLLSLPIDNSWSFSDKTIKDTYYITHGYYTYPAKFIPQLASRLIKENSNENEVVVDPFMGSGTTIVEAIVNKRIGIGIDINNIAYLLARVKTTPINASLLLNELKQIELDLQHRLNGNYEFYLKQAIKIIPQNERIEYWFLPQQKEKLSIIFARILQIKNEDLKNFYLIAFAQILKSCSIWLQKSIKPTRDLNKKIYDPLELFLKQSQKMINKHIDFNRILPKEVRDSIDKYREIYCADSRKLPIDDETVSLIVTSPPYVTSYEYADLHQLPSLWFGYLDELSEFRKKFIGSAYKNRSEADLRSHLASEIISKLGNSKKRIEVNSYYADMLESFLEMKRVLKRGGKACIVIGNTEIKGVKLLNAEVFIEQFINIGFRVKNIIHREIPSKMLPSTRDTVTGRFTKSNDKNLKLVYPSEYILILEKL